MVSSVNVPSNATYQREHMLEIDLRFALNSTPGWPSATYLFPPPISAHFPSSPALATRSLRAPPCMLLLNRD